MDILRIKKAHLPSPPAVNSRKRKERKVVSAAAIHDTDSANVVVPETGSSTGVGTLNHADVGETEKSNDEEVAGSEGDWSLDTFCININTSLGMYSIAQKHLSNESTDQRVGDGIDTSLLTGSFFLRMYFSAYPRFRNHLEMCPQLPLIFYL